MEEPGVRWLLVLLNPALSRAGGLVPWPPDRGQEVATFSHCSQTWRKEWEPGEGKRGPVSPGLLSALRAPSGAEPYSTHTRLCAIICHGPCPGLCCGSMFFAHLTLFSSAPLKLQ